MQPISMYSCIYADNIAQCTSYTVWDDSWRSYTVQGTTNNDAGLMTNYWYRFILNGSNAMMADFCPYYNYNSITLCGSSGQLYFDGRSITH